MSKVNRCAASNNNNQAQSERPRAGPLLRYKHSGLCKLADARNSAPFLAERSKDLKVWPGERLEIGNDGFAIVCLRQAFEIHLNAMQHIAGVDEVGVDARRVPTPPLFALCEQCLRAAEIRHTGHWPAHLIPQGGADLGHADLRRMAVAARLVENHLALCGLVCLRPQALQPKPQPARNSSCYPSCFLLQ